MGLLRNFLTRVPDPRPSEADVWEVYRRCFLLLRRTRARYADQPREGFLLWLRGPRNNFVRLVCEEGSPTLDRGLVDSCLAELGWGGFLRAGRYLQEAAAWLWDVLARHGVVGPADRRAFDAMFAAQPALGGVPPAALWHRGGLLVPDLVHRPHDPETPVALQQLVTWWGEMSAERRGRDADTKRKRRALRPAGAGVLRGGVTHPAGTGSPAPQPEDLYDLLRANTTPGCGCDSTDLLPLPAMKKTADGVRVAWKCGRCGKCTVSVLPLGAFAAGCGEEVDG